ncbi:MAG: tRNA modification GTPase [Planctomycetaceae bacterium]
MSLDWDDVIAAVATPPGPAERSVIRLSGPAVIEVLRPSFISAVSEAGESHWSATRRASRHVGRFQIDHWRGLVPVDLWLWPTSRSYTGQPSAELQFIGSPPVVDAILEQLYRNGARPARAGEFTLRAFLAGRVDLVQAEAVLGVIDAADHEQLQTALTQLAGGLSRQIAEIRELLLLDLADLEAGLDFVDEDIEFVQRDQMQARIDRALQFATMLWQQCEDRMVSGARPRVVLAGLPNAGKSTLFNRLIGEQRAIVSDQAGTTRDYLNAELNWHGQAIELVDTAGADVGQDSITAQAESLRQLQVARADLVVWCSSPTADDEQLQLDDQLFQQSASASREVLRVWTKCDTAPRPLAGNAPSVQAVSSLTGQGIDDLRQAVGRRLSSQSAHRGEWLATTAARSRDSLERCLAGLRHAQAAARQHHGDELISIELRGALDALGEICGAVHTDDILDRIFSRFCIGK